jgi:cytochrome c oxidase subunit II
MTFTRFRRRVRWVGVLPLAVVLGACAADAPQDSLAPEGPLAREIDGLFSGLMIPAALVFILVQGLIVYSVIKFRRRPGDDEWPEQSHGNTRLEIGWTIVPALVLVVVALATVPVIMRLYDEPADAMRVQVMGAQFWWGYEYPDHGGFATANELHIPAGEPVLLELESVDVIHSFWTPRLNGKRDVVPGRTHTWTLHADEPGVFSGQCAEFCGASHANMRLKVVAHAPEDFDEWVEQQNELPEIPEEGLAAEGYDLFGARCAVCHVVAGQFDEVAASSPAAPDLTHLFSRDCFAGCLYDLNDRNEVEAWLRNPQRKAGSKMVIAELSEDEIDALYAYMETLQ